MNINFKEQKLSYFKHLQDQVKHLFGEKARCKIVFYIRMMYKDNIDVYREKFIHSKQLQVKTLIITEFECKKSIK